ncbi:acyl carrier protein [Exilibacterium tricleocarpae]|uniref:Acyl carrier protein n=1 Tax=Exilibacterium tricleocarpae TaxID=2591008 RepID=A0A545T3J6_9GAMM|nr:acyl carrier protein [Exilibacterium tricleocarpae]TQV71768.1 acyl carrier protein [Exilibacterium tricleocarpae]
MSAENEALLKAIFAAVFEMQDEAQIPAATQDTTKSWDSVTHVALITALESEFDLFIDTAEALSLVSYEKILDYISNNS